MYQFRPNWILKSEKKKIRLFLPVTSSVNAGKTSVLVVSVLSQLGELHFASLRVP